MKTSQRSITLIAASVVLLLATAYIYIAYGSRAYFVAFHKPLRIGLADSKTYVPPVLPTFQVVSKLSSASDAPGATRTVSVTVTPTTQNATGYLEVFITGQKNIPSSTPTYTKLGANNDTGGEKVVYQNDTSLSPTVFTKGKTVTYTYNYTPKTPLPSGSYRVSDIITSPSNFTDYYVNYNFAEFQIP